MKENEKIVDEILEDSCCCKEPCDCELNEDRERDCNCSSRDEQSEEMANLRQQFMRLTADFDNYRRRSARESIEIRERASSELIRKLLPVVDNFERAIQAGEGEQLLTGVKMICRQMKDILQAEGLEYIKCEGEAFDPKLHEAMLSEDNPEVPEDTVLQVFETGYLFKGKLLRPAKVKVSK